MGDDEKNPPGGERKRTCNHSCDKKEQFDSKKINLSFIIIQTVILFKIYIVCDNLKHEHSIILTLEVIFCVGFVSLIEIFVLVALRND